MNTNLNIMEGILYLTDDQNKKKYVQIDLEKYGEIWEDFYDGLRAKVKGEVIGYEANGDPVFANDFIEYADKAVKEMREGKAGISIEELKERSKQWLNHTK